MMEVVFCLCCGEKKFAKNTIQILKEEQIDIPCIRPLAGEEYPPSK